ncbi:MAG: hypothetical protein FRX49_05495 [Trebouxia sp. A1-2]|nr:MAG: hypothetical protein FRX49_05495 [Trebouxia sp. A1-2]
MYHQYCAALQAALLCVVASIIAGAGVLITEFVRKMETGHKPYNIRSTAIYKWNVAVGSACWLLVTGMLVTFGWGIFMLFLVHAYSTLVWKLPKGVTSTVSAAAIEHGFQSPEDQDGPAQCESSRDSYSSSLVTCSIDRATEITVDIIVASAVLYFVITYALLLSKLKGYRRKPYTSVQVGLVYNTLQLWLRLAVMTFLMLCIVLLWLINPGWCPSQQFSWLGLMPMQVWLTATTAVLCYAATPNTPQEHVAASSVWLQEFAWTEADKPVKLEARSMMAPNDPTLARQPIFCFQTMMNLLYWSCFVYDHARMSPSARASKGPSEQQEKSQERLQGTAYTARTTLTLETAMSLYHLTESHSFWEIEQDTRCLIGSGNNTVVVAFRGTASMKNALADLQAWRIAHPPIRGQTWLGTRPLVHVGFLKSWLAGGFKAKVVNRVLEAVQQCRQTCKSHAPTTVFVTGHSLGGALATLAAHDIRKQLLDNKQSNTKVVCYTFAAPRTGNHAFAREYNAMVPDTWSIINDQDVVTREGKMLFLYKRPGQRVILNAAGHMMVRPTHMEASVQKSTGGQSVRQHMLTNYIHAVLAVVLAQFTGLGFLDGMEGVIRLAEASPWIKGLLATQMGMSLPEMHAFCQWDPASRSEPTLPGAHMPSKGFWLVKRPTAASTAAAPSVAGRLMHKISCQLPRASLSLTRSSDGV